MPRPMLEPRFIADVLIVGFFLVEALRRRGAWRPLNRTDRGTTLVFWGCYVVTLLALNATAPSPITAAPPVAWIGLMAAVGGLARLGATLAAARPWAAQSGGTQRDADLAHLVFWIGAATASLNVIAVLTVAVAMLAATGVRLSAELK